MSSHFFYSQEYCTICTRRPTEPRVSNGHTLFLSFDPLLQRPRIAERSVMHTEGTAVHFFEEARAQNDNTTVHDRSQTPENSKAQLQHPPRASTRPSRAGSGRLPPARTTERPAHDLYDASSAHGAHAHDAGCRRQWLLLVAAGGCWRLLLPYPLGAGRGRHAPTDAKRRARPAMRSTRSGWGGHR